MSGGETGWDGVGWGRRGWGEMGWDGVKQGDVGWGGGGEVK